jgi:hypothetical protein
LLEVDYAIRVSLNAGSLASEVHVTLPIKIINFVSLDPPPSSPLSLPVASINHNDVYKNTFELTEAYNGVRNHHRSRPVINGVFASDDGNPRILDPLLESDEISGPLESEDHSSLRDYSPDSVGSVEDYYADGDQSSSSPRRYSHCVGGTSLSDDESDDVVDHAIISSRKDAGYNDSPARFSDLYYCSVQEVPESSVSISDVSEAELLTQKEYEETNVDNTPRPPAQDLPMTNLIASDNPVPTAAVSVTYLSRPSRPRGPSSFALRVQEKLQVAIGEMEASHLAPLNTALGSDSSNFDQLLKTVAALGPGSEHCVLSDPDPGYSSSPSSSSTHERCSFELPSDEAGSINRVIDSAAAHSRMDSAIRTSRLLPTLPSATSLDPSATISIPPTLHTDTPHVEPSSVRPRLQQPPGVISSSSVKDKIRELEERMKCSI